MIKKLISIILPIYNEQKNIPVIYAALTDIFSKLAFDYEIIMIDDGSIDGSWNIILELSKSDAHVKPIKFSRNFGHQIAICAGYDFCSGDAIITMDADLQHPPEMIPLMLDAWQQAFPIVYIKRENRDPDSFFKKITAKLHYKLLKYLSNIEVLQNVADFRLIDRQVLSVIQQSKEQAKYLRGMVAWTGFKYAILSTPFPQRLSGTTSYTWKKMFQLAFDGITSFSIVPLKLAAFCGIFVIITGAAMFTFITIDALFFSVYYPLFKWLVTIIYIFIGVMFILLWILGEYLGRIYEQIKGRPLYVIQAMQNFTQRKGTCNELDEMPFNQFNIDNANNSNKNKLL